MITAQEVIDKKIIAISRGIETQNMIKAAHALVSGGVSLIEVAFNPASKEKSEQTLEGICRLQKEFSGAIHVGAGTVLTPENVVLASEAGAEFIISPNVNLAVIQKTKELGLLSMPGAMTPTEAAAAWEAGSDFIKLFPAGDLGPGYIKSVTASLTHLKIIATGGIDENNIAQFRRVGCVGFGVGGSLFSRTLISNGEFDTITQKARAMVAAAQ